MEASSSSRGRSADRKKPLPKQRAAPSSRSSSQVRCKSSRASSAAHSDRPPLQAEGSHPDAEGPRGTRAKQPGGQATAGYSLCAATPRAKCAMECTRAGGSAAAAAMLLRRSGSADACGRTDVAARPSSARLSSGGRPPLLQAPTLTAADGITTDASGLGGEPQPWMSEHMRELLTPTTRQLWIGRGSSMPPLEQGNDATELSLLRARFDLRLDAERVRTQDACAEIRGVCDVAMEEQQSRAAQHLGTMQQEFEELARLQRASEQMALAQERARGAEANMALQAEVAELKRQKAQCGGEVLACRAEAAAECATLRAAAQIAEKQLAEEQHACSEHARQLETAFHTQREAQIEGVVARFEREHFELSVRAAAESKRCQDAEEEVCMLRLRLEELTEDRESQEEVTNASTLTCSKLQQPATEVLSPEMLSCAVGTQTDVALDGEDIPWKMRLEALQMFVAELQSRLWQRALAEMSRMSVAEARTRTTIDMKNSVIDRLKDELRLKEREIQQAKSTLAGVSKVL
eukprot:TRINITY_DN112072_c0_g1_i1.p1 TRINITY_DN112072_c0_g1~~TRINITY_DN112072_c0_g1_i1.p1  ORF type:complete len:521 (+),score=104.40 TRINITY_DN112072_c0_g1_i1:180-1742(+)